MSIELEDSATKHVRGEPLLSVVLLSGLLPVMPSLDRNEISFYGPSDTLVAVGST